MGADEAADRAVALIKKPGLRAVMRRAPAIA